MRYQNPLPAPPCPPKLLDIPTNPIRYTRPEFLDALANDTPLPMIVDAECGMPLDLGKWEALWEDGADDSGARAIPSSRVIRAHNAVTFLWMPPPAIRARAHDLSTQPRQEQPAAA